MIRRRAGRRSVVILPAVMRRRSTALALAALGAALLTGISTASSAPYLRSATASRGHVVAVYALGIAEGDLQPGRIAVAVSAKTQTDGSFVPANVRVQEAISSPTRVGSGYRVRTQHKLRPGRYYVKVSGVVLGLDCTPHKPCRELWSNARRVVIPRP
jgi:hypothetical protein